MNVNQTQKKIKKVTYIEPSEIKNNIKEGSSLEGGTMRCIVKAYLDRKGVTIKIFEGNMPGRDFALSFLQRHRDILGQRLCQNIKRARTQV